MASKSFFVPPAAVPVKFARRLRRHACRLSKRDRPSTLVGWTGLAHPDDALAGLELGIARLRRAFGANFDVTVPATCVTT